MSPLDTDFGEKSHWIPIGGGSGLLGVLTSNQGPLLPLFLFSWGQGAPGSPFQIVGKAWATCCRAVPLFPGFLTRLSSSCCFSEFPVVISCGVSSFAAVPSRETAAGPGLLCVLRGQPLCAHNSGFSLGCLWF